MKLKIFNATLKPSEGSNTQALVDLVTKNMNSLGVTVDTVHLKDLNFEHTTDNVNDDLTPHLVDVVKNCDMISIATPIWWGTQSSLAQGLIERFDPIDSWGQDNDYYALYNKVFGTIVSGGGDGFQHIHGNLYNMASNMGMTVPPTCNLEIATQGRDEIMKDKDAKRWIDIWCRNMTTWATILKKANPSKYVQNNTNRPKYT